MSDTCVVGEAPGDSPGVNSAMLMKQLSHLPSPGLKTEAGSHRLTEKILNLFGLDRLYGHEGILT